MFQVMKYYIWRSIGDQSYEICPQNKVTTEDLSVPAYHHAIRVVRKVPA